MGKQCGHIKANGEPCKGPPVGSDGLCIQHSEDPRMVEARVLGRSRGGQAVAKVMKGETVEIDDDIRLETAEDILEGHREVCRILMSNLRRQPNIKLASQTSLALDRLSKSQDRLQFDKRIRRLEALLNDERD